MVIVFEALLSSEWSLSRDTLPLKNVNCKKSNLATPWSGSVTAEKDFWSFNKLEESGGINVYSGFTKLYLNKNGIVTEYS
jgi:hypothetical protein